MIRDPTAAPTFLSVPGDYTTQQRSEWVRRLCLPVAAPAHPAVLALVLWMAPSHRRDLLDPVDADGALAMLGRLDSAFGRGLRRARSDRLWIPRFAPRMHAPPASWRGLAGQSG